MYIAWDTVRLDLIICKYNCICLSPNNQYILIVCISLQLILNSQDVSAKWLANSKTVILVTLISNKNNKIGGQEMKENQIAAIQHHIIKHIGVRMRACIRIERHLTLLPSGGGRLSQPRTNLRIRSDLLEKFHICLFVLLISLLLK